MLPAVLFAVNLRYRFQRCTGCKKRLVAAGVILGTAFETRLQNGACVVTVAHRRQISIDVEIMRDYASVLIGYAVLMPVPPLQAML